MILRSLHMGFKPLLGAALLLAAAAAPLQGDPERLAAEAARALDQGYFAVARSAAESLVTRTEALYGAAHVQTAEALDLLVRCLPFGSSARDPSSRARAQRAVDLRLQLHGASDARYAASLRNMAELLEAGGAAAEAEPLFAAALQITRDALGAEHPQVGLILKGRGFLYLNADDQPRAIQDFERALAILDAAPQRDTLQITLALNGLGLAHSELGDYVQACAELERAIAMRSARYGQDHARVLGLLNNLAGVESNMGDDAAALHSFRRVRDGLSRSLDDPQDVRIGVATLNVAVVLRPTDPRAALSLYDSAYAMLRGKLGDDHELIVKCLHGLGAAHHDLEDPAAAIAYFEQGLAIATRIQPESDQVVFELRHLASAHYDESDFVKARAACERAYSLASKAMQSENPDLAEILALRGAIAAATGDAATAVEASLQAERRGASHLGLMARGISEREALLYVNARPRGLDVPLRLVASGAAAATTAAVWDAQVASRALVLDAMAARSRTAALAADSATALLVADVRRTSTRLAKLYFRSAQKGSAGDAPGLDAARRACDEAERALGARARHLGADLAAKPAGLAEVRKHLPRGSALVAYSAYDAASNPAAPSARRGKPGEMHLMAFVLSATGEVHAVPIGSLEAVGKLVDSWGELLVPDTGESAIRRRGEALREMIWDPIVTYLGAPGLVFVVPEGALHQISYATLPHRSGQYLVEAGWRIHYLDTERDLVPDKISVSPGHGLLAVGVADFDGGAGGARLASLFPPLRWSEQEAKRVVDLWKHSPASDATDFTFLKGPAASETEFKKSASGKRVLHLATHGFFFGSTLQQLASDSRSIRPVPPSSPKNPLQLSGLAFRGANGYANAVNDQDDGVLLAEEVAALDLQSVELAVLSACDTGRGHVEQSEGVQGLRRAFQTAGARALVMSLWPVSERATLRWMEAFYAARFARGRGTSDAVHEAMLQTLRERRRHGESTHPFYWGAFVATGDWQ